MTTTPAPTFDHAAAGYSLPHAYALAHAAAIAYKDEDAIESAGRSWGFDTVRHFSSPHAMPFPIEDTQAYVMASDRMIVVGFRGTEPVQIRDWLSDASTPPVPGPGGNGYVHYGFNQALASVYPQIRNTVQELHTNGQTLWFTGHSLGGALAMLAGAHLYFEDPRQLPDGVYTFGQPRTCEHILATAHRRAFKNRHYRFVNNNDVVPNLPPEPFTHVDHLRYFDRNGKLHDTMPLVAGLADRGLGRIADPLAPASDGVRDHFINNYLAVLAKNLAS
ncbi:lipase family protein [Yinghuangia sp. YIM S10712]|uniref:lipase family protein n=1 Tax=Yinghuangia sp. YIM S10712 TaxID=3436930 RepID=UPI003F53C01C